MASKRATMGPNSFKNTPADSKSSKGGNVNANNSGAAKKGIVKSSGTIVKSRYLQSIEKSASKSNSLTNESLAVPLRPSSPTPSRIKSKVATATKCSLAPQEPQTPLVTSLLEGSLFGKSLLQSTFSDGPCIRPDFDISVINDRTVMQNAGASERNSEYNKWTIELQTFQLAFLTAKMQSNTATLKAEAESRILEVIEEEEKLHNQVHQKKRQLLLTERNKQMKEVLHLQIASLSPMAETSKSFTREYKTLAAAIDTTRHELPVKNCHIDGDRREFLDKVESRLKESEKLLLECALGDQKENGLSLEGLRNMKTASNNISQQLSGTFSQLLELSSLVCRHTIHTQQAFEEEQLSTTRTQELYCPKH